MYGYYGVARGLHLWLILFKCLTSVFLLFLPRIYFSSNENKAEKIIEERQKGKLYV